jgi:hypothetical protein
MIPYFELSRSPLSFYIDFLFILSYFQIMFYFNYLLFHFFQHVWPDCNSVYWVIPADWNLALSTIEGLKRDHLQLLLIAIVVGKIH